MGRVSGVREVAEKLAANGHPRIFIEISEWAEIKVPNAWHTKSQNPVWYNSDLASLNIAEHELRFQPVPHGTTPPHDPTKNLADVKREIAEIARLLGVPVSAVKINIRP